MNRTALQEHRDLRGPWRSPAEREQEHPTQSWDFSRRQFEMWIAEYPVAAIGIGLVLGVTLGCLIKR